MTRLLAAALPVVIAALAAMAGLVPSGCASSTDGSETAAGDATLPGAAGDAILAQAFADRAHDLEVGGQGTVVRILVDDTDGGRHQRFIVRLAAGQTLLIAHNIDVAPRVEELRVGDTVAFRGVYEWSEEGGTVHWTHRDPDGVHAAGWIRHEGHTYE